MEISDSTAPLEPQPLTTEQLELEPEAQFSGDESDRITAMLEAIVYVTDEPLTAEQIADALGEPRERVSQLLEKLVTEYCRPCHGLTIREVAGGYKMSTKPEHHEAIRAFVKRLQPPLKLSIAALETLAVVAYKQPVTAPEILEIRGVQGAGVLKTLLDRKLITTAGRKNVVGRPILYKTTKDFLVQFGLKELSELPTLKEFEELKRMALGDDDEVGRASDQPEAPMSEDEVGRASARPDATAEDEAQVGRASARPDATAEDEAPVGRALARDPASAGSDTATPEPESPEAEG